MVCWIATLCLAIMRPLRSLWLHSDSSGTTCLCHCHGIVCSWNNLGPKQVLPMVSHVLHWAKLEDAAIWAIMVCCVFHNELDKLWWIWSLEILFWAKSYNLASSILIFKLFFDKCIEVSHNDGEVCRGGWFG